MHFDARGLGLPGNAESAAEVPSYVCGYEGCSVRYTPREGYFTVIETPDLPEPVEEPGVNLLQCPRHAAWLYRSVAQNSGDHLVWRCGIEGCDYTRSDFGPAWPSL
jgi:hypothetical protein